MAVFRGLTWLSANSKSRGKGETPIGSKILSEMRDLHISFHRTGPQQAAQQELPHFSRYGDVGYCIDVWEQLQTKL